MFVAIILVCAQAIVQEMRDCTLESASENVKLSVPFVTERRVHESHSFIGPH
jgi:hypothetical protein